MQASVALIRCTVVDGRLTRDVEISAVPETETAAILASLPFYLAGRTCTAAREFAGRCRV